MRPYLTMNFVGLTQRVLEHCDDPKTQQIMMDEILASVCMLAQDQYGNYVVQVSNYLKVSKVLPLSINLHTFSINQWG